MSVSTRRVKEEEICSMFWAFFVQNFRFLTGKLLQNLRKANLFGFVDAGDEFLLFKSASFLF